MHHIRESVQQAQYSVREISEQASQTQGAVRFDIGQPDFDSPPEAKQAAIQAIENNHITYTSLWGIPELRQEIASFESHKTSLTAEHIMATTGGIGALYAVFSTICEPGDNILFNDPCWMVYSMLSRCSIPEFRQTPYFQDGNVNIDGIEQAIDENTQAIVINNPENPTGRVYSRKELNAIIDIAQKHDLWIIGDEVYDKLVYGRKHVSVAELAPHNSILINSMSKNFAMTGWRLGWVACKDTDLIHQAGKLNRSTTACPNFVSQHAALEALRSSTSYADRMRQQYQERKKLVEQHLDNIGLDYVDPEGAIYIFPDIQQDSWKFAKQLLKQAKVSVVPGAPCGKTSTTNIRICFGSVGTEGINKGMERLKNFLR